MDKEPGFEEECIFSSENFQQTLCGNVASFLTKEAFVNVKLICRGEVVKAHQVILAACSPFFEEIFISDPHPSPKIVFPDITKDEMMLLLDFMYKGRISVGKSLASSLLKTAKKLQICGLEDQQVDNPQETSRDEVEKDNETTPNLSPVLTENLPAPPENQNKAPAVDHDDRNKAPKWLMVDRIPPKKKKSSKKVINPFAKKKQSFGDSDSTMYECDPDVPGPSESVQKPPPLIPSSPINSDSDVEIIDNYTSVVVINDTQANKSPEIIRKSQKRGRKVLPHSKPNDFQFTSDESELAEAESSKRRKEVIVNPVALTNKDIEDGEELRLVSKSFPNSKKRESDSMSKRNITSLPLKETNSNKNKETMDVANNVEEPRTSKDCESVALKEPFEGFTTLPLRSLQNFCVVCQKHKKNIKDHISRVHNKPIRQKKFTCKTCSLKYYTEKSMEMHKCKQAKNQ